MRLPQPLVAGARASSSRRGGRPTKEAPGGDGTGAQEKGGGGETETAGGRRPEDVGCRGWLDSVVEPGWVAGGCSEWTALVDLFRRLSCIITVLIW